MLLEQNYIAPLLPVDKSNMSNYPNIPTPPSSNEDSPQPVYFVASPNSSSFHAPDDYEMAQIPFNIISQPQPLVDINTLKMNLPKASLSFVEEPVDRFRFRYKSEMAGTHGSLTGINSDKSRKQTYPTVELKGCTTPAIIRCSIYQVNHQGPHAHRLIMKRGKEEQDDPHDLPVGPEDGWQATFHGMGIIHTAKKNIVSELVRKKTQLKEEQIARDEGARELTMREQVEIKGLAEAESKSINLNIVCLRFDAFIKYNDTLFPICEPKFSHGINNLKSALTGELKIVRIDHVTSPASGGKEIFVLVERVTKKNIKIRFFELDDKEDEVWSDEGRFNDLDVHHQYAIVFKTPKYKDENIDKPVKVFMELVRPSDNARSDPRDFTYLPSKMQKVGAKRARYDSYYSSSSYNSSNVASDELPVVINNLNLEPNLSQALVAEPQPNVNSWNNDELLTEAQITRALNDINSDEFRRMWEQFGQEYCSSIGVDAPMSRLTVTKVTHKKINTQQALCVSVATDGWTRGAIKLEVSEEERQMAGRTYEELYSFTKTTHKPEDERSIIRHHLGTEKKTNALHVFISQNKVDSTLFFLKFIAATGQYNLLNVTNSESDSPLQLAVRTQNEALVKYLIRCKAKVGVSNGKMNTALHTALEEKVPIGILEMLLTDREHEKVMEYVNLHNGDGNTALILAIENRNLTALKLLYKKGADINRRDQKSGFTPLRVAIEKQYLDAIKYILSLPRLEAMTPDFKEVAPLRAARQRECSKEILEVIEKYITENNLEMEIKEEIEEDSDEEIEEEADIKMEDIPLHELEQLYEKVPTFTSRCLDEVAAILNSSGKWEDLAVLLDLSHMIRSGMIPREPNVSKQLLRFAIETNKDTLWEIRNFLENLDELQAVEAMDRMVHSMQ